MFIAVRPTEHRYTNNERSMHDNEIYLQIQVGRLVVVLRSSPLFVSFERDMPLLGKYASSSCRDINKSSVRVNT
jgi:hypothetical protein